MAAINCNTNPVNWNSCPSLPGRDPVDNYMSTSYKHCAALGGIHVSPRTTAYSTDNLCRSRFTSGQVERMIAQYELYRKPAFGSTSALRPTPKPTPVPTPSPVASPTPGPLPFNSASFLSYFAIPVQTTGVGAKLPTPSPPKTPTCSTVFTSCEQNSECCRESCVYLSYTGKSMCWV